MGSKGRMWGLPEIVRWNVTSWLLSSLCEKHSMCYSLTRSHISSIVRQFPSLPVQLKNSLRIPWVTETLGKLFHLHQKQHCAGRWWSSHRFHLAYTVRTQKIEPHAVLFAAATRCSYQS